MHPLVALHPRFQGGSERETGSAQVLPQPTREAVPADILTDHEAPVAGRELPAHPPEHPAQSVYAKPAN